jgi:hypothetical protein
MIYFIKELQLKANLKKYDIETYDKQVLQKVNQLHQQVVSDLLKQKQKQEQKQEKQRLQLQKGGRVAMPIDFFGGQTNGLAADVPAFTNISGNEVNVRQPIMMNDPTGILGTETAMASLQLGGAKKQYQLSQNAAQEVVRSLAKEHKLDIQDKRQFVQLSKQKFETTIHEILKKAKKGNDNHLSKEKLQEVLEQKKYKSFKA